MLEVVIVLAALVERPVTGGAEHLRQRLHTLGQTDVIVNRPQILSAKVRAAAAVIVDPQARLHRADDDRRARRRADTGRCVKPVEPNATRRQPVDVRRLDDLVAVAAEPAADILKVNPKDVRSLDRLRLAKHKQQPQKGNGSFHSGGK